MKKIIGLLLLTSLLSYADIKSDLAKVTTLLETGKNKQAKELLIKMTDSKVKNNTTNEELLENARYNLGNIYYAEGNIEKAKEYYTRISNNVNSKSIFAKNANQQLLNLAVKEGNVDELVKQIDLLNRRTSYSELPFLANAIYIYENNNKTEELENFKKNILSKLNKEDRAKINYLVYLIYFETNNLEKAKVYATFLSQDSKVENRILANICFASIAHKENDKEKSLEILDKTVEENKNISISLLEQIRQIYSLNQNQEKAYDILIKMLNKSSDNNLLILGVRYADFLNKEEDARKYLTRLEKAGVSNINLGIRLAAEKVSKYAEEYLLKAEKEGNKEAVDLLIKIYFGNLEKEKLSTFVDDLLERKIIAKERSNEILTDFKHYVEFINREK